MFERFTDDARRVVVLAQEEARLLHHNDIGTEHLLLALLSHDADGIGAQALLADGITYERARVEVVEIVGRGGEPPAGHIPFTPRAKHVLELSLREALEAGHDELGSEHILLGLIREGSGVGVQVLVKLGADLSQLRHQVISLRGLRGPEPERAVARGAMAARAVVGTTPGFGPPPRPVPRCSLCGRSEDRVGRILVAGGVTVCDQCVRDAATQLDELPDAAPKRIRFRRRDIGIADRDAAAQAIERAFDAVVGPMQLPIGEAWWAVEGGEELEPQLQAMKDAAERAPVVNDVTVERVRFLDDDEAEVSLGFWMAGSTSAMSLPAHAVLRDGTWKVSRSTIEQFAQQAQAFRRPPL